MQTFLHNLKYEECCASQSNVHEDKCTDNFCTNQGATEIYNWRFPLKKKKNIHIIASPTHKFNFYVSLHKSL